MPPSSARPVVVASGTGSRPRSIPTSGQAGAVVQGFFAGQIGQVEPVLGAVMQHALQSNGRAAIAGLGVMQRNDFAQCGPWHDGLHGRQALARSAGLRY